MTYELRMPINYSFGTLSTAAAISDTTLQSADFASLPSTLSTTQYVPIVLQDPTTKLYEIVWINAHTASSTSVTVLRGREGTSARAWPSGTLWTIAPTLRDAVLPVANRAALPAANDAHVGSRALLLDELRVVERRTPGWLEDEMPLPGSIYRSTDDADTTSTTEKAVITTGTISLEANSTYIVRLALYYFVRTSGDRFDVYLRETNTSGTILRAINGALAGGSNTNMCVMINYPIVTGGSSVNKSYCGTLQRNPGSGTAFAQIGTHLIVSRLGHSSLLTTV